MTMYFLGWTIALIFLVMWGLSEWAGLNLGIVIIETNGNETIRVLFPDLSHNVATLIIILAYVMLIWEVLHMVLPQKIKDRIRGKLPKATIPARHVRGLLMTKYPTRKIVGLVLLSISIIFAFIAVYCGVILLKICPLYVTVLMALLMIFSICLIIFLSLNYQKHSNCTTKKNNSNRCSHNIFNAIYSTIKTCKYVSIVFFNRYARCIHIQKSIKSYSKNDSGNNCDNSKYDSNYLQQHSNLQRKNYDRKFNV